MRIVYVVNQFGPQFLGGADIYTYGIAAEMSRAGHEVFVVCVDKIDDPSVPANSVRVIDDTYEQLPVRRFSFDWRRMNDPYGALTLVNRPIEDSLIAYLQTVKPDVVHVTELDRISAAAISAPQYVGVPVVLTLCGRWLLCPSATLLRSGKELCQGRMDGITCMQCMFGKTRTYALMAHLPNGFAHTMTRLTASYPRAFRASGSLNLAHAVERRNDVLQKYLSKVDLVISPSRCFYDLYSSSGLIPQERMIISTHGHDIERVAKGQLKTPSKQLRFGFAGNVVSAKGVDILIKAFRLLDEQREIKLHIFGKFDPSSQYGQDLQKLASNDGRIHFFGSYTRHDISRVFAEIDVLVVPSRWIENAPVTISEAYMAKTPIIGSDVCGVAEWIQPEVNGLHFGRDDVQDLAAQMLRFVNDPDLLPRMRSAIQPVKSTQIETKELATFYQDLIKERA